MILKDAVQFLYEVKVELSKVIWPKWDEFVGATIVVLVLVVISAIYLGFVDLMFSQLSRYIFRWYSGY